MPMGLRVIRKVEAIVREEMNRAGALELLMPVMQPAELWQESGRWEKYGPELLRLKDRHERDFIVSRPRGGDHRRRPAEIRSYRQMPRQLLPHPDQVPRRAAPALRRDARARVHMKDAYSFDRRRRPALVSYQAMYDAYVRIFDAHGARRSARSRPTPARSAAARRHEFQVIADTGEDAIAWCPAPTTRPTSSWPRRCRRGRARAPPEPLAKDADPGAATLRGRGALLGLPLARTVKSLVLAVDELEPLKGRGRPGRIVHPGLAAAGPRRPRAQRGQGRQAARPGRLPVRDRGRDRRGTSAARRATSGRSAPRR
jgi:prolyl-tRNA synthetase